jgi:hypothetical protein
MILTFARCGNNAREAVRLYREQFPQRQNHPDHKTILKLIARGRETGQMQPVRREVGGAPKNVRTVEHEEAVLNVFEEDGTRSIRTVSREMGLYKSSVQRVLADNRRHPYHHTRVQHLLPEDYPIRREFCLWLIYQNDADPHFLSRILFSDESLFCREGCSNYHNLHIWAEENPRELFPRGFQHRFSVNLWTGLLGDRLARWQVYLRWILSFVKIPNLSL